MGKKMSTEVERVCQSFEFLLVEYKQRLQGIPGAGGSSLIQLDDAEQRQEFASSWLVEAVKQAGFDLYEKIITILESAVYHMEDAKNNLRMNKQSISSEPPGPFSTEPSGALFQHPNINNHNLNTGGITGLLSDLGTPNQFTPLNYDVNDAIKVEPEDQMSGSQQFDVEQQI